MVMFFPFFGNVQILWLILGLMVVIFVNQAVVKAQITGPQARDGVGAVHQQQRGITVQTEGYSPWATLKTCCAPWYFAIFTMVD